MLFAIGMAIESASRSSGGIERKVTAQQDVRGALEIMALEIKMASYNPSFSTTIWRSDGNPGGGAQLLHYPVRKSDIQGNTGGYSEFDHRGNGYIGRFRCKRQS